MIYLGNLKDVQTEHFMRACVYHAQKYNAQGRTFDVVLRDTVYGESCELLVGNYFGYAPVPFEEPRFDLQDQHGRMFEVKHTKMNTEYWNFTLEKYNFFVKNAQDIDSIFLVYVDSKEDAYLKYKANADNFIKYVSPTKYPSNYHTHYYNVKTAQKAGYCTIY